MRKTRFKILTIITIDHAEFFHQVPDDILADMLPLAKKVAIASGLDAGQYNLLQVRR
jgi:diadenosine tetraphosphate (Ap4A) HIT family hydrolase